MRVQSVIPRGAVVIEAPSFDAAVLRIHELGIHPGGNANGWPLSADAPDLTLPRDVLIPWEEMEKRGYQKAGNVGPGFQEFAAVSSTNEVKH
jgi:hypothetical protein